MEGVVYAAYCHMQDIVCSYVASIAGINNAYDCNINCKALERVIVGMVLSSKQLMVAAQRLRQRLAIVYSSV